MIMLILPLLPSLLTLKSAISSGFGLAVASHSIWRRVREKNQSASILYWTQFLTHLMALRLLLSTRKPTDRANDRWSSRLQQFGYRIWDTSFLIVKCPLVLAKKKSQTNPTATRTSLKKQSHFQRHPNELAYKGIWDLDYCMRAMVHIFFLDSQIVENLQQLT